MGRLIALLLLGLALPGSAQPTPRSYEVPGSWDLFTTDEMGNVYALRGDVLELSTPQGKSWLRNSLKTFGRISTIDAFTRRVVRPFARDLQLDHDLQMTTDQDHYLNAAVDGLIGEAGTDPRITGTGRFDLLP